jgi:transposase InsO family protein
MQNGHVESFHGRLRDECLNVNWFLNLWDARRKIAAWRIHYNTDRIRGWDTGRRRSSHRPWPLRRPQHRIAQAARCLKAKPYGRLRRP